MSFRKLSGSFRPKPCVSFCLYIVMCACGPRSKWGSLKPCQFLDWSGYFRRKSDATDGESYDPYDFSEAEKEMPQGERAVPHDPASLVSQELPLTS